MKSKEQKRQEAIARDQAAAARREAMTLSDLRDFAKGSREKERWQRKIDAWKKQEEDHQDYLIRSRARQYRENTGIGESGMTYSPFQDLKK